MKGKVITSSKMNGRNLFILLFTDIIETLSLSLSFFLFSIPFFAETAPPKHRAAILIIGLSEVKITGWFPQRRQ